MAHTDTETPGLYTSVGTVNLLTVNNEPGVFPKFEFDIIFYELVPHKAEFRFPEDVHFKTIPALIKYLNQKCRHIFHEITLPTGNSAKKITFKMSTRIFRIKFNGGLNFILGFYECEFVMINPKQLITSDHALNPSTYTADLVPQLDRGVKNMYIYASCCAPVYVGHAQVPLLKNIFVDASHDASIHGYARNH